jgi:HEAT repeat protein
VARFATLSFWLALVAAAPAIWSGCKTDSADPFDPFLSLEDGPRMNGIEAADTYATRPLDPKLLANDDWYERPPRSYAERQGDDRLWHHPALDPYLHPKAPRRDLSDDLLNTSPIVATNAAIVSVHWRTGAPVEHLTAAIRSEKFPLPMRCAAAEALGFVEEPSPGPALRALLRDLAPPERPESKTKPQRESRELPDLHAELIRALARHAEPEDAEWLTAALANRAWKVRMEGIAAWAALVDLSLPPEAIELAQDRDSRVRAAAVRTIAAHRDPRSLARLQQALGDSDADVRKAAMLALERMGTADAKALVNRAKRRGVELQQAAVAASQAARGLGDDLSAAARDTHSQVRHAVAETLDEAERRGQEIAAEATASTHEAVHQATAQFHETAEAAANQMREVRQLAQTLRSSDLTGEARHQVSRALEQLAKDADAAVRAQAAQAMGQVADPAFLPALMVLLSDKPDVQVAAMASLAAIAGRDVAASQDGRPLSRDEKIRLWQLWYREQANRPQARR